MNLPTSPEKSWLAEFLLVRGMTTPDGSPLYLYNCTEEEFKTLKNILQDTGKGLKSSIVYKHLAALFCLYVSERYRREYGGLDVGWFWSGFENPIGVFLKPIHRREIVTRGLAYWKRPVQARDGGNDYLGSLFNEGGLPWPLIQNPDHGFGRAMKACLKNYYRIRQRGDDVASYVEKYADYFPQTFRTTEKFLLIASVVEWLMGLAEDHPVSSVDDPADYLDENAPDWRKHAPLPVSEYNARNLVNEWLIDAGKSRLEKKRLEQDKKNYTCEHYLEGDFSSWSIKSEVFLPAQIDIELREHTIQSTRLEIAFYEGEKLIQRSGIAHGKVNDDRSKITVNINHRSIIVRRSNPQLPVTVKFLSNGHPIYSNYFSDSDIDCDHLPMIFVQEGEKYKLLSTASTLIPVESAVVRIPRGHNLESDAGYQVLGEDSSAGLWVEIQNDTVLGGEGSRIVLQFKPEVIPDKPSLTGTIALFSSLPNLTYRGFPHITASTDESRKYTLVANGTQLHNHHQQNMVGSFSIAIEGELGETVLRKKIGVIPQDLQVSSVSTSLDAARIILRSSQRLSVAVLNDSLWSGITETTHELLLDIEPLQAELPPEWVSLAIQDDIHSSEAVILRLPFPKTGVQVFDELGNEFESRVASLDQLIELGMVLTPRPGLREQFFISLELKDQDTPNFRRYYAFAASNQPQRISLFTFQDDIQQMLAATSSQDAIVRIRVETDRVLKQLDIVRYNANLNWQSTNGVFEIISEVSNGSQHSLNVCAMRLDNPHATPIDVPERQSEGVAMGVFEIPFKMMKSGPWLLFSKATSTIKFRPTIWVNREPENNEQPSADTLHSAAKQYHPTFNPQAFENVLPAMAIDFGHSGWDYLKSLKQDYEGLPLSAFESWKALADNSHALAVAVFRLEFDSAFCKRLSNELAVIWETVTIQTWIDVISDHKDFLMEQGLPEVFVNTLIDDRVSSVSSMIPCFLHFAGYLKDPRSTNFHQAPYQLIRMFYEDLRRNHADDQRWPEWLDIELGDWIQDQSFPAEIKTLPDVHFSKAVTYMPVFLAAVTAGEADFNSLGAQLAKLRFAVRVLSDFDREGWYEPIYSLVLSNLLQDPQG